VDKHFVKGYWIKEEVGKSDHSIVYSASFSVTGKDVALKKLITPALLLAVQKEDAINNFLGEVSKRSTFTHPNVLELYDCFEHENDIYFIVESAIGKSLKEYEKSGRYYSSTDRAMYFFEKAADALRESSAHNYLHRNMKPENFMITRDNELKITDYMLCSLLYREQQVRSSLDADRYENVSHYSAPETVEKKELTARSNIFSLGVIMYECLTGGTHPFRGHSDEETYEAIIGKNPVQARVLNPSLPEVVNYILDRALKKDPFERYADFSEMLEDFDYYFSNPHEDQRLNLYRTRGFANAMRKAGDFSQKYFRLASRKAESFTSQTAKRIKKNPVESLFVDAELDPSKVRKKKAIRLSDDSEAVQEKIADALPDLLPPEPSEEERQKPDMLTVEVDEEIEEFVEDQISQEKLDTEPETPPELLTAEEGDGAEATEEQKLDLLPVEAAGEEKQAPEPLPAEDAMEVKPKPGLLPDGAAVEKADEKTAEGSLSPKKPSRKRITRIELPFETVEEEKATLEPLPSEAVEEEKATLEPLPSEAVEEEKATLEPLTSEAAEEVKPVMELLPPEAAEGEKPGLDLLPSEAAEKEEQTIDLLPPENVEEEKPAMDLLPPEAVVEAPVAREASPSEIVSPSPLRPKPGEPFFYRRLPFIQENQNAIMLFSIAGILLFLAILAGAYVYGRMTAARPLPPKPTKVVANTGSSGLLVTCNISDADIELKRTDDMYPPIAGRLDYHGNWEVSGIASGAYELTIRKEGYYPFFDTTILKDKDRTIVNAEMGTKVPVMDITTTPGDARISLDGSYIGVSPLKTYDTRPGEYELAISLDGYGTYKEKITIFKGEVFLRKITLEKAKKEGGSAAVKAPRIMPSPSPKPSPSKAAPPPSTVFFDSRPSVASVFLDGREVGTTPFEYILPGSVKTSDVTVKKKGYRDWNDTLMPEPGKRQEIFAELESTEPAAVVSRPRRTSQSSQAAQSSQAMNVTITSSFSRTALYDKMRGEEVVIDFQRDKLERRLNSFAQDQILEAKKKGKGGNFRLNVYFAIQVDTKTRSTSPTTRLIGTFQLTDEARGRTVAEESDSEEFTCDVGSMESIPADYNNYSRVRIVSTSAATEKALQMINRKLSSMESAIQSGR